MNVSARRMAADPRTVAQVPTAPSPERVAAASRRPRISTHAAAVAPIVTGMITDGAASSRPPTAGPTMNPATSIVTSNRVTRSASRPAAAGTDAASAGYEGVATAIAAVARTTPARGWSTARATATRVSSTRRPAMVARTTRSRPRRSPIRDTHHEHATYGANRAVAVIPRSTGSWVSSHTSTSSQGHGTDMAVEARAWLRSNRTMRASIGSSCVVTRGGRVCSQEGRATGADTRSPRVSPAGAVAPAAAECPVPRAARRSRPAR